MIKRPANTVFTIMTGGGHAMTDDTCHVSAPAEANVMRVRKGVDGVGV